MRNRSRQARRKAPSETGFIRDSFSCPPSGPTSAYTDRSSPTFPSHLRRPSSCLSAPSILYDASCSLESQWPFRSGSDTRTSSSFGTRLLDPVPLFKPVLSDTNITDWESAARLITAQSALLDEVALQNIDFRPLWQAVNDPPINIETLGWLDLHRLPSYARLYHSLNFERETVLHAQSKPTAGLYWCALGLEFALYIQHRSSPCGQSLLARLAAQSPIAPPSRLRRLLETIHNVLKTLIPATYAGEVDAFIDVDMLHQQISNSCCNLTALAEWIGCMLKLSCSEQRDPLVNEFVRKVRAGAERNDACLLVSALELLFHIFEEMKLVSVSIVLRSQLTPLQDMLNSYIRINRPLLIADSIACEQRYFHSRIDRGWDISAARSWYRQDISHSPDPLLSLANLIALAITDPDTCLPETFEHDDCRIKSARLEFSTICTQFSASRTHHSPIDSKSSRPSKRRRTGIQKHIPVRSTDRPNGLAKDETTSEQEILSKSTKTNDYNTRKETNLALQLQHDVRIEMQRIRNLSSLDTHTLLVLRPLVPHIGNVTPLRTGLSGTFSQRTPQQMPLTRELNGASCLGSKRHRVLSLARRIAHIAVINFRVWHALLSHDHLEHTW